jgi:endonuclease III
MWRESFKRLEETIALAGPHRDERLQALRAGAEAFRRSPDLPAVIRGPVVPARRALKRLPQMNESAAHRMLLFAADRPILPIDASVSRVARRLGYGNPAGPSARAARSLRGAVARELPADSATYRHAYLYLSHHGAAACTEGRPHCSVCPVRENCPEGQKRLMIGD